MLSVKEVLDLNFMAQGGLEKDTGWNNVTCNE
jgi:hypothetical protein